MVSRCLPCSCRVADRAAGVEGGVGSLSGSLFVSVCCRVLRATSRRRMAPAPQFYSSPARIEG